MSRPLKIIFAGTPDFAAKTLQSIIRSHHQVIAVYTQPDRRSGRGKKITSSAVKSVATEHNIATYQPTNFKEISTLNQLADIKADLMVVVAYGILLPIEALNIPKYGCVNVHASLLPRWRGAAPIERSLLAGDCETGITIMQMDEGLDTGAMLNKSTIAISDTMTSGELHDQLIPLGATALLSTLNEIAEGTTNPEPQDDQQACYASKLSKAEGGINWSQTAEQISRKIRGLSPRPIAFSSINELTVRIWNAEQSTALAPPKSIPGQIIATSKLGIIVCCGDSSAVTILSLQLPGGKALKAQDLLNSKKDIFSVGNLFESIVAEQQSS
ncbi:MAG: methionyl-tRNA formyltransferase [Osedax symbiont Rs1]|nr:MAG: methionyl-tRNA formyltransferase [Osedax symbiont Rs1]